MSVIKNSLSTANLVALVTGLLMFSLAPQQLIHERFSLLERATIALVILLGIIWLKKPDKIFISIPTVPTLLILTMVISVIQMPALLIIKDLVAFIGIALYAVISISSFGPKVIINGLVYAGTFLLVANSIYTLIAPEQAFVSTGPLKGMFYGENSLGISLLFALPAILSIQVHSKKIIWALKGLLIVWMYVLLLMSTSITGLAVFWGIIVSNVILYLFLKNTKLGLAATSAIFAGVLALLLFGTPLAISLGKGSDFSGRFPLWDAYVQAIFKRPLQGFGWHTRTTVDMPLGELIQRITGIPQINANNDLLNWWALSGIFAPILVITALATILVIAFRMRTLGQIPQWAFLTGIGLALGGITELSTMHPDGWFTFVASLTALVGISPRGNKFATQNWLLGIRIKTGSYRGSN